MKRFEIASREYRSSAFRLHPATLELPQRGVVAVFGPNGAGKSTMLAAIADRRDVVFLPQDPTIPPRVRVKDLLRYAAYVYGLPAAQHEARMKAALDVTDLTDCADQRCGHVSGGQRRRALIAQMLMSDRPVVVLDEPTVGLAVDQREAFKAMVQSIAETKLVLISTHMIADVAGIADHVVMLHQGRIVFDDSAAEFTGDSHAALPEEFISNYRALTRPEAG